MNKRLIIIGFVPLLCISAVTFAATNVEFKDRLKAADDHYSITINAEDVTTSEDLTSGSFTAYTEQLNNPVSFNYENIAFEQDGDTKYIVFGEDAWFGNDKSSQIRKINDITIYGDGGVFSYDFGWTVKTGVIQYTNIDRYHSANGSDISLSEREPNYFVLMHRDGEDDVKISKIIFTYSKDCTPGVKPAVVLTQITLSDQTTTLKRGDTFSFGGTVTAHYNDDTTADVTTRTTFSGYNMSKTGSYAVTASYTEGEITQTATYTLTVDKAWSTIWSGNVKLSNNSGWTKVCTLSGLSGTVTLRVTWSCSASGGSGKTTTYYNNKGSTTTTTKPSNPFQFNLAVGSYRRYIVGVHRFDSDSDPSGRGAYLYWSNSDTSFGIQGSEGVAGTGGVSCSMTVTKIERYY